MALSQMVPIWPAIKRIFNNCRACTVLVARKIFMIDRGKIRLHEMSLSILFLRTYPRIKLSFYRKLIDYKICSTVSIVLISLNE